MSRKKRSWALTRITRQPVAFTYLSFGAGVQSTFLLVASALGIFKVPKIDVAIFADTKNEPPWVYENLEYYTDWAATQGVEVATASLGNLLADCLASIAGTKSRFASIPLWTMGEDGKEAPTRRQCTREYKIEVLQAEVRRRLGYKPRQRNKHHVRAVIGISFDEMKRMAPSQEKWISNCHPLVDAGITRDGCKRELEKLGLPVPRKSSCIQCPYHTDEFWLEVKGSDPQLFEVACRYDEALRDQSSKGMDRPVFVHRSCLPLREVDFAGRIAAEKKKRIPLFLWGDERFADGLGSECDGVCGV